jgi:hypothetical protein
MRRSMYKNRFITLLLTAVCISACERGNSYYQCITDRNSDEGVKAYVVEVADAASLHNPGLVFLARGVDQGEAFVLVNGHRYEIPALLEYTQETDAVERVSGKEGWYTQESSDELLGKIVLPLSPDHVKSGVNRVVFDIENEKDGYSITDARLSSIRERQSAVLQLTYRVVTRGEQPRIADFDFVVNYEGEGKRDPSDLPEWAQRGKVRYYRAGINFDHLDRLFEMFAEGHFNLVMLQVSTPQDLSSDEYKRYKDFIDRCHENGIRVTFDGGAGGQAVRLNSISFQSVQENPEMMEWVSRD